MSFFQTLRRSTVLGKSRKSIYKPQAVTTFTGDDAGSTVPITGTYVKIDAGGSAREGARFAGTGEAGQILYVENVGGEKITFHNTTGTSLGNILAAQDTMAAGSLQMFISNGSLWQPIAAEMRSS